MTFTAKELDELLSPSLNDYVEPVQIPIVKAVSLDEFLSMDLPPRENLLDPWLPRGGLVMIHAMRGVGKTFFALEVAMVIAYGAHFLSFKASRPAKVLYLDGEMPANAMQERLAAIKRRLPVNADMIAPIIVTPDLQPDGVMFDLSTSEGRAAVQKNVDEADLIIVDNISTLCGSINENAAEEWAPIQGWLLCLRRQGKSVMLIHHSGKTGLQRGTSKREDILDTVILLKLPKDHDQFPGACFEIHFEKNRGMMGDDVKSISCHLAETGWQFKSLDATNYQRVVELAKDGLAQKDIAAELGLSRGQVSKLYNRAIAAKEIKK